MLKWKKINQKKSNKKKYKNNKNEFKFNLKLKKY